jgi:hypothetical protein
MRVKRLRIRGSGFPTGRVRFSGATEWIWPAAPNAKTWVKHWYIDLIKYNRSSPDSYWEIHKTYNWDVVGTYYPQSFGRFKTLREFTEWLFVETL